MIKRILNYIFCGIITLTLACCGNDSDIKSDKDNQIETDSNSENKSDFIYSAMNREVKLIFENNATFLDAGKPTKLKFETKGMNKEKVIIFAAGFSNNPTENNDGFTHICTPLEKDLKNGKLEIQVTEGLENGETFDHVFQIPVKQQMTKN